MDMRNCGAGLGRGNNRLGHLLRRHGNIRVLVERFTGAGHRAGNKYIPIHLFRPVLGCTDRYLPYRFTGQPF